MFSRPQVNTIESDEGFSVQVIGRLGILYSQNGKMIHIGSEVLDSTSIMINLSKVFHWDSGESINPNTKKKLIDNILRAFSWAGTKIEVR